MSAGASIAVEIEVLLDDYELGADRCIYRAAAFGRILLTLQRASSHRRCEWPQEARGPGADHRGMKLSDIERDKLLLTVAAELAWRRRARGLRLNYPETVAVLSSYVLEGARDGRTVAELMDGGRSVLKRSEVMDGIPEMLAEVQMEATFPDGTKLVTIHEPLR